MATNTECVITIEQAIEIRDLMGATFRGKCPECGGEVHVVNTGASAHFEHLPGNKNCKLSDHHKNPDRYGI